MALQLARISVTPASGERRHAQRRTLSLGTLASSDPASWRVVVHNLSETGLRMQTGMLLHIGDTIEVELPETESVIARVIWADDTTYGCEFLSPISKGGVSAALLRSPADTSAAEATEAHADFLEEEHELELKTASQAAVMASMLALLLAVGLFIYALLELPFSI